MKRGIVIFGLLFLILAGCSSDILGTWKVLGTWKLQEGSSRLCPTKLKFLDDHKFEYDFIQGEYQKLDDETYKLSKKLLIIGEKEETAKITVNGDQMEFQTVGSEHVCKLEKLKE